LEQLRDIVVVVEREGRRGVLHDVSGTYKRRDEKGENERYKRLERMSMLATNTFGNGQQANGR
jgi:hypothetical protein